MTATVRLHPLDAVSGMRRYLFLLLIPLVRGLAAIGDGWMDWLRGAWIDLCVLAAMLLLGCLRWRYSRLRLSNGRMTYSRGLFFKTEDIFFANTLSAFRISRPFYLRPVRAAIIKPETPTREAKVFYPILVHYADIRMLERLFLQSRGDRVRAVVRPKPSSVALAAAASSSVVGGLTFAAAFFSNTARYPGEKAADNFLAAAVRVVHRISVGLPPAVVFPLATLLVAYLLAFLLNLTEYYRFTVSRSSRSLYIGGGLFTRYHFQTRIAAIESVDLRFGLISRWFAGVNVYVNAAGLGSKAFTPAVIPASDLKEAVCRLRRLLPEFGSFACPIKTDPKTAFSRYMTLRGGRTAVSRTDAADRLLERHALRSRRVDRRAPFHRPAAHGTGRLQKPHLRDVRPQVSLSPRLYSPRPARAHQRIPEPRAAAARPLYRRRV